MLQSDGGGSDAAAIAFSAPVRLLRRTMTVPPRARFHLSGHSIALDDRIHAVRGDLADLALAGQHFVPHYAVPMPMVCTAVSVPVLYKPVDGEAASQLLLGEIFMAVDIAGGWVWGFCSHDHYVGYVPETALSVASGQATGSVVTKREAIALARPQEGAETQAILPLGAKANGARSGDFVETAQGFVHADALNEHFSDPVAVAERLVDVPYVWGGRSGNGIDCSGLVQQSLALTGRPSPRDSDQQREALGTLLSDQDALRRNDLVFFPGHVGMMVDSENMIHATRHYGKVVVEPLADVIARTAAEHEQPVLARKRIV